jgi:hypothetical protein
VLGTSVSGLSASYDDADTLSTAVDDEVSQAYQWARRADDILTRHPDGPAVAKLRNAHDRDLAAALSAEPINFIPTLSTRRERIRRKKFL